MDYFSFKLQHKKTVIGKAEGEGEEWHGHVTAVTVAPEYRRQGLAALRPARAGRPFE